MRQPPPITAIVVCLNEADKLDACLASLAWCDELIVIDLGSTDGSRKIAEAQAHRVLSHPPSPIVEPVRCFGAEHARNDWLLFVDPDERFPAALVGDLAEVIATQPMAGIIKLPWQFYFKGERLDGTVWGGPNRAKRFVIHRGRSQPSPFSHAGARLLPGFEEVRVEPTADNHVQHLWMESYGQLIEKHWRYARFAGESHYQTGRRFRAAMLLIEPLVEFKRSFRDYGGWRLGVRGLLLSVFYGLYLAAAAVSLLVYQVRNGSRDARGDEVSQAVPQAMRRAA